MKTILVSLVVFLSSCASKEVCPDINQEPVSYCRAKQACTKNKTLAFIGVFLGGIGGGRNDAANTIESCVDRNISAQKANTGIVSNDYRCISKDVGNGKIETQCTQQ